ncbi:MAG: hypothetical protein UHH95_05390 [Oscillospiraceae bacterium]|nr:hypothetical protein [Oscillospiraceae bacterium]
MNLISCNFNCKYQREGYCFLSDTSGAKHCGNSSCIYFDPPEEKPQSAVFNSSDDSEPL